LRAPFLFFEPRLYAEEGAVYLVHAWQSSFWEALCYIFSGYFSLIANLAAALAACVFSVEAIPRVTLVLAFFVQALPHYILFFRYSQRFTQMQKILLSMSIIFISSTGEIWLNTITSQFHLAVSAFLILIDTPKEPFSIKKCWPEAAVLLIAGLSGMISVFLLPAFGLRYAFHRHRQSLLFLILLTIVALLQLSVFFIDSGNAGQRFANFSGDRFSLTVIEHMFFWPLLGDGFHDFAQNYSVYFFAFIVAALMGVVFIKLQIGSIPALSFWPGFRWESSRLSGRCVWEVAGVMVMFPV
jgi:hypothetical protein